LAKEGCHHRPSLEGHQLAGIQSDPQETVTRLPPLPHQTCLKTLCSGKNDEVQKTMDPQHVPTMWHPRRNHYPCVPMPSRKVSSCVGSVDGQIDRGPGGPGHRASPAQTAGGSLEGMAFQSTAPGSPLQTKSGSSIDCLRGHWMVQLLAG
jgi:hypothetical protein